MSELKAGDKVFYVPSLDHWSGMGGKHFHYIHVEDGPPPVRGSGKVRAKAGEVVEGYFGVGWKNVEGSFEAAHQTPLGCVESRDPATGIITTTKGYKIKQAGHKRTWQGVIRREAAIPAVPEVLDDEGKVAIPARAAVAARLVLDVVEPLPDGRPGFATHHIPLDTLAHDPTGTQPHSYHTEAEAK